MGKELVKKKIDGHTYEFGCRNPKAALHLFFSILQNFGVSMSDSLDDIIKDAQSSTGSFLKGIFKSTDPDKMVYYMEQILNQAIHSGTPDGQKGYGEVSKCFPQLFTGNLSHMFKVAYAALEVEYSDFLGKSSVLKDLMSKVQKLKNL